MHNISPRLTSCFQQFMVSWYSCWFLCSSMLMMLRSVMLRFFSKSCRILIRIIEGEMLSAYSATISGACNSPSW